MDQVMEFVILKLVDAIVNLDGGEKFAISKL